MARLSFTGGAVIDDRGVKCQAVNASALRVGLQYTGVSSTERLSDRDRARRELWFRARRRTQQHPAYKWASIALLGVIVLLILAIAWRSGVREGMLCTGIFGCVFAVSVPLYRLYQRGLEVEEAERLAGLPFVCVACTYDIDALHPEEDGCIVCPECGGVYFDAGELEDLSTVTLLEKVANFFRS